MQHPTPQRADLSALQAIHDQAEQRLAQARRALSAAQSEYQKAQKDERATLLALVTAKEAMQ
ncbi:MAG: hypothetical protein L6Q55_03525 [Azonexus sp.]|nr:hypothetical protein [Azonexus sp.]MCK6411476.1 hypothetical protein [Azonexus sp.]